MSRLAIVSAMHEELRALHPLLTAPHREVLAGREFHLGQIHGHEVVLVRSGIGKVAAAMTATLLVHHFQVRQLVFTGVAGGLGAQVQVGDVVVARHLIQHDMDASPLFPRFEVPLTGRSRFDVDATLSDALEAAARRCLASVPNWPSAARLAELGVVQPSVHRGLIASGDRFVSGRAEAARLRADLPEVLAVEMEGAALAQVCADFQCPCAVLRTVSDRADDDAHGDFTRFVAEVASAYTLAVIEEWLRASAAVPSLKA